MPTHSLNRWIRRRKELLFFVCSLVLGGLVVWAGLSGWLEDERWGEPVAVVEGRPPAPVAEVVLPDFAARWRPGGRDPFAAAVELEPGGAARLPWPPAPPLRPAMPPAPMVRPLDVLTEGSP